MNKARLERKQLRALSSVEVGGSCTIDDCCREVRLGTSNCKEGDVLSGYNTLADRYEEYEVIQVSKNSGSSRVKRIK